MTASERDFYWYLSIAKTFNFDGTAEYTNKKGQNVIIPHSKGASAKAAFKIWDSNGIVIPTRHPNILHAVLKAKGSVNLHIKMYAEDIAKGFLLKSEVKEMVDEFKAPSWFEDAIIKQSFKFM